LEDNCLILVSLEDQIARLPANLLERIRRLEGRTASLAGSITEVELEKSKEGLSEILVESLTTDLTGRIKQAIVEATVSLLIEHGVIRFDQDAILNQTMVAHILAGLCCHCGGQVASTKQKLLRIAADLDLFQLSRSRERSYIPEYLTPNVELTNPRGFRTFLQTVSHLGE